MKTAVFEVRGPVLERRNTQTGTLEHVQIVSVFRIPGEDLLSGRDLALTPSDTRLEVTPRVEDMCTN